MQNGAAGSARPVTTAPRRDHGSQVDRLTPPTLSVLSSRRVVLGRGRNASAVACHDAPVTSGVVLQRRGALELAIVVGRQGNSPLVGVDGSRGVLADRQPDGGDPGRPRPASSREMNTSWRTT